MALWTIRCLLLVDAVLLFCQNPCGAQDLPGNVLMSCDTVERAEYNVTIKFRGREVTGICVMERTGKAVVKGTMMNEFGTKILDFTHYGGKTEVFNVIGPLDRWFIRRRLRKDFSLMFSELAYFGTAFFCKRRGLYYEFTPLSN